MSGFLDVQGIKPAALDAAVAAKINTAGTDTRAAVLAAGGTSNALGMASNPVKDPAAARPAGVTSVWWLTATQPTNWVAGDVWVVTP